MELVSLKDLPKKIKLSILKELGHSIDKDSYILNKKGERVKDKYIEKEIKLDHMLIMPGSTIIIDDNELSLSLYLEEFGDVT